MNPELLRATRLLVKELQKNDLNPDQQEAFIRQQTGGKFGVAGAYEVLKGIDTGHTFNNLGRSLVQGALFNFGDEIVGMLPGGEGPKEEMRLEEDLYNKAHPVASGVVGLAGGIALPGFGATKALKGISTGKAILTGSALGGTAAAAAGAGAGTTPEERLSNAVRDFKLGAVVGAAIPAVAGGVTRIASRIARANRRLDKAIKESGGIDALRTENARVAATGRGDEATLGTLTEPLASQLDYAANADPTTFRATAQNVARQAEGAGGRLLNDIDAAVGSPVAAKRASDLRSARLAWADSPRGYAGLRDRHRVFFQNDQFMQKMRGFIEQPKVRDAWSDAREINLIGPFPETATPSFEQVQSAIFKLDGAAGRAFRGGDRNLGQRLKEAHDYLRGALREAAPGYKEVDAKYARRLKLEEALEAGSEWFRKQGRIAEFREKVAGLSRAERKEFRTGLVSEFIAQLENAQTNRNVAQQLTNGSPLLEEKLKVLFPSPAQFRSFMEGAETEAMLLRRGRAAAGGSQTARRQMEAIDPAQVAAAVVGGGAAGGPAAAAGGLGGILARRAPGAMARRTAAELGPLLLTRGHIGIDDLLKSLQNRPTNPVAPWFSAGAPTVTGGMLGGQ